jgi:hypothetical protein
MKDRFAHMSINTRLLTASQSSEAIEKLCTRADLLDLSSNQWNASSSETLHVSSDFATIPTTHNVPDPQDVSFSNRINQVESIRFSSKFTTLAAASVEPADVRMAEYIIK